MTNFKKRLLAGALPRLVTVNILSGEFEIKLLTAAHLAEHDKSMSQAANANNTEKLNSHTAQLIIDSLIDDGEPVAASVTVKDLVTAYRPMQLSAARDVILKANYARDGAMDEAKNG